MFPVRLIEYEHAAQDAGGHLVGSAVSVGDRRVGLGVTVQIVLDRVLPVAGELGVELRPSGYVADVERRRFSRSAYSDLVALRLSQFDGRYCEGVRAEVQG